ncbi:MAG: hypothetical protein H7A24_16090 [Leptospiraceae bacterium]|nr:hypothetical protein [Leptospiraceae bacterium]MCP5513408.1 hypothetical protein [Leptospiraceae bacterium]
MRSEQEIRHDAFELLRKNLGSFETEIFISSILRDQFDYTLWRDNLPKFKTVEELSKTAMEYRKKNSDGM